MIKDRLYVKRNSKEKFIIIDGKNISYKDFNIHINKMIIYIDNLNRKITRMALSSSSSFDMLAALIACNRMNIIPIIIPPTKHQISGTNYLQISKAEYFLNKYKCIIQENSDNVDCRYKYNEDDVQCVLFTSGSTGKSKAVELTFNNIYYSAKNWDNTLKFLKGGLYLNILPMHHIAGLSIFFRSIYCNFISVVKTYKSSMFVDYILKYNIDYISLVPRMMYDIMNNNSLHRAFKKIKLAIIGGDTINQNIYDYLQKNKINSYISYGMTETSSGISGYFINQTKKYQNGYIGAPHNNVIIDIKNRFIHITSKTVMKKYTNNKLCNNQLLSADIGEIKNNKIFFFSREKDFIVSGGENISLKVIEKIINSHSDIIDSAVVGYKDKSWGEIPVLIFESKKNQICIDDLIKYCKENLPDYMIPKHIIKINKIPYKNNRIDNKLIKYYINASIK